MVTDKDIVRYVGFDTYCRLRKAQPDLYVEYMECWTASKHPGQIEVLTFERDPVQIKAQLVEAIATGRTTLLTEQLVAPPTNKPIHFDTPPTATFMWILWLFVILFLIIGYLAVAGHVEYIFTYSGKPIFGPTSQS